MRGVILAAAMASSRSKQDYWSAYASPAQALAGLRVHDPFAGGGCRRLDMASDQCGVGVSGWWWVSDILRGMSLDGLVAQMGQVLGDARGLYGAVPQGGGWSSTQALSAGRDGIATAGGVVVGWGGVASSTHLAASGGRVLALDNVIGADGATGSGFGGAADTSQSGRSAMTGVVDDTRRGVAAIAPSTDTAAGKRQLVDHLQLELDRAKSLLKVSEQRNVMLAQLIRGAAGGYGGAGSRMGGGMSPGGAGRMSPTSLGGGGCPASLTCQLSPAWPGVRARAEDPGIPNRTRCAHGWWWPAGSDGGPGRAGQAGHTVRMGR